MNKVKEEKEAKELLENQKKKVKEKNKIEWSWIIKVTILSFVLSIVFSLGSDAAVANLPVIPAIIILILVILLGVVFDIIGVAVTVADESEFHAKATKKLRGAKESVKLIKNAGQVSNICADVIGDICGVLSGAISAVISVKITEKLGITYNIQFLIGAFVASLTIGGKAIGKGFARKHSTQIISILGKVISIGRK